MAMKLSQVWQAPTEPYEGIESGKWYTVYDSPVGLVIEDGPFETAQHAMDKLFGWTSKHRGFGPID